ncbi:hypothetical protein RYX36_027784 [Vicia faba]
MKFIGAYRHNLFDSCVGKTTWPYGSDVGSKINWVLPKFDSSTVTTSLALLKDYFFLFCTLGPPARFKGCRTYFTKKDSCRCSLIFFESRSRNLFKEEQARQDKAQKLRRKSSFSNRAVKSMCGKALQSEVLRLGEEMFLVDAGPGTPRNCMQDEPTGVPINRATRFENKVGFLDLVANESLIKKKILERLFIDLVAGESLIKEQATARFNDLVGSIDVVVGEPLLLLPRRFRQN